MTLRKIWLRSRDLLLVAGIDDASLESEVLIRYILGIDRATFFANLGETVHRPSLDVLDSLVLRRIGGEPLAYILGYKEFYGLDICVTPDVLVPRQETETLVEKVIEIGKKRGDSEMNVADVGTGSGAIAVAIAHYLKSSRVNAIDASKVALDVADLNCRKHNVADRVVLTCSDLFDEIDESFDMIVSNPPYISTDDIPQLSPEVRREPIQALDGGYNGTDVISRLLGQAPRFLQPAGTILLEINPPQLRQTIAIARKKIPFSKPSYFKDLSGAARVVVIQTRGN